MPFFVGAGAYKHHVPATVDHLIQRSEFLTSYTPYQPEIAQGTLQYLFEFQTQVALLAGLEVANASLYDGSTATAEAVMMAQRVTRRPKAILSGSLHPHYAETVETVAGLVGEMVHAPVRPGRPEDLVALIDADTACVVVQSPDVFGLIHDLRPIADAAHAKGALLIVVVTEVISLGLIEPPGTQGADIVAAEGQSIGNGLNFGGPYVGLFATREKFLRQLPGRIAGETVDNLGRRGFVLTLSTREQHIRREKATSNICTNSGLCCLAFTIHLSLLGDVGTGASGACQSCQGLVTGRQAFGREGRVARYASFLQRVYAEAAKSGGGRGGRAGGQRCAGRRSGVAVDAARTGGARSSIVAATEMVTEDDMKTYVKALSEVLS